MRDSLLALALARACLRSVIVVKGKGVVESSYCTWNSLALLPPLERYRGAHLFYVATPHGVLQY